MLRRAILLVLGILFLSSGAAPAANPFDGLLKDVPYDTNVLVLLNPQRAYSSALAKQQDWLKQYWDRHRAGVTMLPPDARQAVIAANVNFNTFSTDFQVALVGVRQTATMKELQAREGGTVSQIGDRFVLLSPRDAYITSLNVETLATVYPANRQAMARWLRYLSNSKNTVPTLSPPLRKSVDEWSERAEVVVALDLTDAIDPGTVRDGINSSLGLSGKTVNRDALARVLASANGLTFAASIGTSINCTLKVDFGLDPQPMRESVRALFLELLDTHGMQIPGLSQWPAVFNGTSMTLTGTMQVQDLKSIIGLFQFPTHEAEPPAGTPPPPAGTDVAAVSPDQTRRFLGAVDNILVSLKLPPEAKTLAEANTYTKAALAIETSAEQIDHLSRANVDPIAVDAALEASKRLKAIASSLKGVPVDLNVINAGSYYSVSGGWPGWIGWGRGRGVPFVAGRQVNTNLPQTNERMLRVIADDQKKRDDLMGQVQSVMNDAKQKLAEKYGGKW